MDEFCFTFIRQKARKLEPKPKLVPSLSWTFEGDSGKRGLNGNCCGQEEQHQQQRQQQQQQQEQQKHPFRGTNASHKRVDNYSLKHLFRRFLQTLISQLKHFSERNLKHKRFSLKKNEAEAKISLFPFQLALRQHILIKDHFKIGFKKLKN